MNDLQKAFDNIHAEEDLKRGTMRLLQNVIQGKSKPHYRNSFAGYGVVAACCALVALFGIVSYSLYFTPKGYIGVDINPSIELTINRFDQVIDTWAFNPEGEEVLSNLVLRNKNYNEAANLIMDEIETLGYWREDGLVSVSVQADDSNRENSMLAALESTVNTRVQAHHPNVQVDIFSVDSETLEYAHDENMSAAKYLAVLELQELDPTVTMESCRRHSVGEIRQVIEGHHGNMPTEEKMNDASNKAEDHGNDNAGDKHGGHSGDRRHN